MSVYSVGVSQRGLIVIGTRELTQVASPNIAGTYQVGDALTVTPGTYDNAGTITHQWYNCPTADQGIVGDQTAISGATGTSYTLQTSDEGLLVTCVETANPASGVTGSAIVTYMWGTTAVTVASGGQLFFPPGDASNVNTAFNLVVPSSPVIDTHSASWCASTFTSGNVQWSSVAVQTEDGWPVYRAISSDPQITVTPSQGSPVTGVYLPEGATPSSDSDGHLIIIQPDGVTEYEFWQASLSGTWPSQTLHASNASGPFNTSTSGGELTNGSGYSARGSGICCVAGLIMQAEYDYALANGTPIPHALAASMPFNGSGIREPAIDSDGGNGSSAVQMGTRFWLPRSVDISGLPAALYPIALTMQEYGWFDTDSEGGALGFQGQMISGTDAAYLSLDQPYEGNDYALLSLLPWADMEALASWNGT